jgi:CheY-like chemotaxis protein
MDDTLKVMLVDDSEDDLELFQHAVRSTGLKWDILPMEGGIRASQWIEGSASLTERERRFQPQLIVLDLRMPGTDGFEVLRLLKTHRDRNMIVVIVFSAWEFERDVARCYDLGANSYLVKPTELGDLCKVVALMDKVWRRAGALPVRCAS